ncbi:MAG: Lpg1974 family pore-forming outer membrane protein [Candidatus Berkiella sp.]
MKTAIKVTLGTMLVAGFAATAQAGSWNRVAVTGTATYTEATSNAATMGDAMGPNDFRRAFVVEPDHELDFGIGLSYRLGGNNPASDTRLYLDYDHFSDDEVRSASGLRNIGNIGGNGVGSQAILDQKSEQFRAGITQTLHFGQRLDVTLNGFLEYLKLDRSFSEATGADVRTTEDEMKGFGPGFGAAARGTPFSYCPEFGIFGGANTSLLYAQNEYTQAQTGAVPYFHNPEDSHSVVAKLDAEFGVDYRRVINSDMARVLFHAALGVRYVNAINAFKSGNTSWNPADGAAAAARWTGASHDFGRVGPFLRVTIGGADA